MTAPTCPQAELVTPLVDGELEPAAADAFRAHLGECSICAEELRQVVQLVARISDLPSKGGS